MKRDLLANDRVFNRVREVIEGCAEAVGVNVLSIVVYGSRARNDFNSRSDYEILVLLDNDADLKRYVRFNEMIKLELLKQKYGQVKILSYTSGIFEDLLYNDNIVGTFLYMILRENIVIQDRLGTFSGIRAHLALNNVKTEEQFLLQCIEFCRILGSEKWQQRWEKTLMQQRYLKNRRDL